jgi:hypothetical protein
MRVAARQPETGEGGEALRLCWDVIVNSILAPVIPRADAPRASLFRLKGACIWLVLHKYDKVSQELIAAPEPIHVHHRTDDDHYAR